MCTLLNLHRDRPILSISTADMRLPLLFAVGAVLLFAIPGCTNPEPENGTEPDATVPSLLGQWLGDDETTFVFAPDDSSAMWIFPGETAPDTFTVEYRFNSQAPIPTLDLRGFDRGFLAGRTLYCIVELRDNEQMRMDCEPGSEEDAAADVRPQAFDPEQTRTYRRLPDSETDA